MPVKAIKIGLVPNAETAEAIHSIAFDYPNLPIVLDPVIQAGGGTMLASDDIVPALRSLLIPITTIVMPNSHEAMKISENADSLDAAAAEISQLGVEFTLITGTHEKTAKVVNTLYHHHRVFEVFKWDRLPESYHGSGCTLAACTAGLLAQGAEPLAAVHQAQEYTWRALSHAYHAGMGQPLPNRLFWAQDK